MKKQGLSVSEDRPFGDDTLSVFTYLRRPTVYVRLGNTLYWSQGSRMTFSKECGITKVSHNVDKKKTTEMYSALEVA